MAAGINPGNVQAAPNVQTPPSPDIRNLQEVNNKANDIDQLNADITSTIQNLIGANPNYDFNSAGSMIANVFDKIAANNFTAVDGFVQNNPALEPLIYRTNQNGQRALVHPPKLIREISEISQDVQPAVEADIQAQFASRNRVFDMNDGVTKAYVRANVLSRAIQTRKAAALEDRAKVASLAQSDIYRNPAFTAEQKGKIASLFTSYQKPSLNDIERVFDDVRRSNPNSGIPVEQYVALKTRVTNMIIVSNNVADPRFRKVDAPNGANQTRLENARRTFAGTMGQPALGETVQGLIDNGDPTRGVDHNQYKARLSEGGIEIDPNTGRPVLKPDGTPKQITPYTERIITFARNEKIGGRFGNDNVTGSATKLSEEDQQALRDLLDVRTETAENTQKAAERRSQLIEKIFKVKPGSQDYQRIESAVNSIRENEEMLQASEAYAQTELTLADNISLAMAEVADVFGVSLNGAQIRKLHSLLSPGQMSAANPGQFMSENEVTSLIENFVREIQAGGVFTPEQLANLDAYLHTQRYLNEEFAQPASLRATENPLLNQSTYVKLGPGLFTSFHHELTNPDRSPGMLGYMDMYYTPVYKKPYPPGFKANRKLGFGGWKFWKPIVP